jgi:hypothetical protein
MVITWKRASAYGLSLAGGLLGTLLAAAGAEVWNAKNVNAKDISEVRDDVRALQVRDADHHELLIEMRQDIKDILREVHK